MSDIEHQIREVERLVKAGQTDAARATCVSLIDGAQSDYRVWQLAADVAMRAGERGEALQYLQRALQCAPGNPELLLQLAQYLLSTGRRADARAAALEAAVAADRPGLLDALGTVLTHCGEAGKALALFERAVRSSPTEPLFRYNLAMAQRMVGELERAEANLDIVLSARPNDGQAQNARSGLRTQTAVRNHVLELRGVLSRVAAQPASVAVEFALAKELEDLGEFAESFRHLAAACRRVRASIRYDVNEDVAVLEALVREHTAAALAPVSRIEADECIFIVGLPRSGTTLVERILGSHPRVFSAGELDLFPRVTIEAVTRQGAPSPSKLGFVGATLGLNFGEVGAAYLARARESIGPVHRFTDKLPFNYLYAGLIHASLPRAKFLAIHRNPLDVCYAMYKTLFASAYPFSYDLLDLARYYVSWDRLMRHWAGSIGHNWLALRYEDLIFNQEECTRRLLAHCGLDWAPESLDFHKNARPVTTASAAQVRRPLYSDSVGRWRVYQRELEPLIEYLENHGIPCRE